MTKQIKIELDLSERDAKKKLQDLANQVGDTETAFEDAESAGKSMARAIEKSADDMISELDETRRAVDALERALGPDFDGDTTAVVADLRKVGLTAQEIETDADELAAALRRAGDVKIRASELGFNSVDEALGRTTDNSRTTSTAIGGIGNSISELPGIGSLGPVAESMGMLAENALEGEANIKGLALAGGGLVAMGLVLKQVQGTFQRIAEYKAFRKQEVEDYTDALRNTGSAVEAVAEKLRDAGELTISLGEGLFEFDVVPFLAKAGVSVEQFSQLVAGGDKALEEYAAAMQAAGVEADTYNGVIAIARDQSELFTKAQGNATAANKFFGSAVDDAAGATEEATDAVEAYKFSHDEVGRAIDLTTRKLEGMSAELSDRSAFLSAQEGLAALATQATTTGDVTEQQIIDMKQDLIDYASTLDTEAAKERVAELVTNLDPTTLGATLTALDELEKDRQVRLVISLAQARGTTNTGRIGGIPMYADGTRNHPGGPAIVGDGGEPEIVDLPKGSTVTPLSQIPQAPATPSSVIYVTQNFPAGTRPVDVVNAQRQDRRIQGPRE